MASCYVLCCILSFSCVLSFLVFLAHSLSLPFPLSFLLAFALFICQFNILPQVHKHKIKDRMNEEQHEQETLNVTHIEKKIRYVCTLQPLVHALTFTSIKNILFVCHNAVLDLPLHYYRCVLYIYNTETKSMSRTIADLECVLCEDDEDDGNKKKKKKKNERSLSRKIDKVPFLIHRKSHFYFVLLHIFTNILMNSWVFFFRLFLK